MLAVTIPTFFSRSFYGLPKNGGVRKDGCVFSGKIKKICSFIILYLSSSIISPFVFDQIRSNASFFDGSHEMRAGIWTIHFGYDKAGLSNFHQLRDELMVYKPHFFGNFFGAKKIESPIGLLETDLSRIFFGNTDVVDYLANELNMYRLVEHVWCVFFPRKKFNFFFHQWFRSCYWSQHLGLCIVVRLPHCFFASHSVAVARRRIGLFDRCVDRCGKRQTNICTC